MSLKEQTSLSSFFLPFAFKLLNALLQRDSLVVFYSHQTSANSAETVEKRLACRYDEASIALLVDKRTWLWVMLKSALACKGASAIQPCVSCDNVVWNDFEELLAAGDCLRRTCSTGIKKWVGTRSFSIKCVV